MTIYSNLDRRVQLAAPGAIVELFELDLTPLDVTAPTLYFFDGSKETSGIGEVHWQGNTYVPLPIKVEGCDVAASGSLPRPTLFMSNVLGTVTALIKEYGGVGGAILTRWQTFDVYLDDGPQPNPDGHLPVDVFVLDRISAYNRREVQIECRSFLDFEKTMLPARIIFQGACTHTYRAFNATTGQFDYTKATCPYADTPCFDEFDNAVSAQDDNCGRRLSSCRARFGTQPLPTRQFPGVGRFR